MIPDYQTLMLPVLKAASDQEVKTKEVVETLAKQFNLTQEEREQMLPSGQQRTFDNRVHWAKSYLKQAGLLRYPKRGSFVITDEGKKVLDSGLDRIDTKYLRSFGNRSIATAIQAAFSSLAAGFQFQGRSSSMRLIL